MNDLNILNIFCKSKGKKNNLLSLSDNAKKIFIKYANIALKRKISVKIAKIILQTLLPIFIYTNYTIPEECIKQYESLNIGSQLGEGVSGIVYNACIINDCNYILKIVPLRKHDKYTEFKKECKYSKLASDLNIGPKLIKSWICENVKSLEKKDTIKMGFILMEKMTYTLEKYILLNINNKKILNKLKPLYMELCKKMIDNNFYNKDLHFKNIMINDTSNEIEMKFIDWDDTINIKNEKEKYLSELKLMFALQFDELLHS